MAEYFEVDKMIKLYHFNIRIFQELFDFMGFSGGQTEPINQPTSDIPARFVERLEFFNTLHQKVKIYGIVNNR